MTGRETLDGVVSGYHSLLDMITLIKSALGAKRLMLDQHPQWRDLLDGFESSAFFLECHVALKASRIHDKFHFLEPSIALEFQIQSFVRFVNAVARMISVLQNVSSTCSGLFFYPCLLPNLFSSCFSDHLQLNWSVNFLLKYGYHLWPWRIGLLSFPLPLIKVHWARVQETLLRQDSPGVRYLSSGATSNLEVSLLVSLLIL